MFIHISKDKFIRQKEIIGVFDLDTSTVSGVTKSFLSSAEKNGRTVSTNVLPNSFVLAGGGDCYKIYFSSSMSSYISDKSKNSVYQQAEASSC